MSTPKIEAQQNFQLTFAPNAHSDTAELAAIDKTSQVINVAATDGVDTAQVGNTTVPANPGVTLAAANANAWDGPSYRAKTAFNQIMRLSDSVATSYSAEYKVLDTLYSLSATDAYDVVRLMDNQNVRVSFLLGLLSYNESLTSYVGGSMTGVRGEAFNDWVWAARNYQTRSSIPYWAYPTLPRWNTWDRPSGYKSNAWESGGNAWDSTTTRERTHHGSGGETWNTTPSRPDRGNVWDNGSNNRSGGGNTWDSGSTPSSGGGNAWDSGSTPSSGGGNAWDN